MYISPDSVAGCVTKMLLKELRRRYCLIRKIFPTTKYIENCTELNLLLVMVTEMDLQQAKLGGY
jgi:hypothetical protein